MVKQYDNSTTQYYSFFQAVEDAKTRGEKIALLRSHMDDFTINAVMRMTYDMSIQYSLPDERPRYKPSEIFEYGNMNSEIKRFERVFVKGAYPDLPNHKIQTLFINVLEYVHPADAILLCGIIERKLPFKSLNEKLIKEARPELFKNEVE